ncbi:hypothetical protein Q0M94_05510 [Deinococcus radiomollis]|uniref:hypothetical protein n=1 Tax=Deinococcus radiomollis TaxID=468916 RepID=UPI0038924474
MTLRLNLGKYLQRHQITAYRLVGEVQGKVAPNTIYSLARKPAQRIDLKTVGEVIQALERLTGDRVVITDMLEEVQDSATPPIPQTLENLLAQMPQDVPTTVKKFSYSGRGRRADVSGGPSVVDIVAEGRER